MTDFRSNEPDAIEVNPREITIGQWATYFDTGLWSLEQTGALVAPEDLTVAQLKDHLLATGGAVYLRQDGKLIWIRTGRPTLRNFLRAWLRRK